MENRVKRLLYNRVSGVSCFNLGRVIFSPMNV
jgi:hypothetical protein